MGFDRCDGCVEGIFGELIGGPGGLGVAVFAAEGATVAELGVVNVYGFVLRGGIVSGMFDRGLLGTGDWCIKRTGEELGQIEFTRVDLIRTEGETKENVNLEGGGRGPFEEFGK